MTIFDYERNEHIGTVESVDTSSLIIKIEDNEKLRKLQVNHLVVIQSSKVNQHLIGLVSKIMRKSTLPIVDEDLPEDNNIIENVVKVNLIGTHIDKVGNIENVFKRTLESVPEINAECFDLKGDKLTKFMRAISRLSASSKYPLSIGKYTLDDEAEAWLDGNKLFQRHAVIVGSTGSGKSWSVARLLEQIAELKSSNVIVFDIHGEYGPLNGDGFSHLRIAGSSDRDNQNILFLPYWLLTYEEKLSLLLDRSDNSAPNQAMAFSNAVLEAKRAVLENLSKKDVLSNFTVDSPVPYSMSIILENLKELDKEMVPGSSRPVKGPFNGKLTRFIQRLESKTKDRRLNFLFSSDESLLKYDWMESFCKKLLGYQRNKSGIKIIDFSEVPSDILPLIVSLVARLVFSVQQWSDKKDIHPVSLFCDEAHQYIPERTNTGQNEIGVINFERIAKEGRKYGVGLVVISQRPAEVNRTVLSQCSNFIAMRLTNSEDQSVIKRLLPDSLGDYADMLPILDVGEALIVGDASLLPSRIKVTEPNYRPNSGTINFWDEWSKDKEDEYIGFAVECIRNQSRPDKEAPSIKEPIQEALPI